MWKEIFVEILREHFRQSREANRRYSIRAYAKRLAVAPGPLSELLRGSDRWKVTPQRATEILIKLKLSPAEKRRFQRSLDSFQALNTEQSRFEAQKMEPKEVLRQAQAALAHEDHEKILNEGLRFPASPANFDLILEELREFQKHVLNLLQDPDATQMFCLSVQLFPFQPEPAKNSPETTGN